MRINFFWIPLFFGFSLFSDAPVILVTGGAGYIGSHTCKALKEAGFLPVTYDSLASGEKKAVQWGPFFEGDLLDEEALECVFTKYKPEAVFHFAALRNVGDSMKDPSSYYTNNVVGSIYLLNAMIKHKVKYIIFSSSCSVYGNCSKEVISEGCAQAPINPYGMSKHMVEKILSDYAQVYSLKYMILRYFNAAGIEAGLRRSGFAYNFVIPRAMQALYDLKRPLEVFGAQYPTQDGTAIRDYIHVKDLASAHVKAFHHLKKTDMSDDFNLGTGKGYSVLEIIDAIEKVTHRKVPYELKNPREGDAAKAIADTKKAEEILDFKPLYSDLNTIIQSEWDSFLGEKQE